jgi:hypothetical protein
VLSTYFSVVLFPGRLLGFYLLLGSGLSFVTASISAKND